MWNDSLHHVEETKTAAQMIRYNASQGRGGTPHLGSICPRQTAPGFFLGSHSGIKLIYSGPEAWKTPRQENGDDDTEVEREGW